MNSFTMGNQQGKYVVKYPDGFNEMHTEVSELFVRPLMKQTIPRHTVAHSMIVLVIARVLE